QKMVASTDSPDVPDFRCADFSLRNRSRAVRIHTVPVLDDLAYSVSYGVVAVAGLLGMWVRGFDMKRDAVLWCILITFVAIHAIYFPANSISRLHGVRAALLR